MVLLYSLSTEYAEPTSQPGYGSGMEKTMGLTPGGRRESQEGGFSPWAGKLLISLNRQHCAANAKLLVSTGTLRKENPLCWGCAVQKKGTGAALTA